MILDGWGINPDPATNAVALANTPNLDKLLAEYPHSRILTSGMAVGLPEGQMGNSEVGHLNIGAGRVVYQDLTRSAKPSSTAIFSPTRSCSTVSPEPKRPAAGCTSPACSPTAAFTPTTPICTPCWNWPKRKG